jgi:hypothetical protein
MLENTELYAYNSPAKNSMPDKSIERTETNTHTLVSYLVSFRVLNFDHGWLHGLGSSCQRRILLY